MPRRIDVAWAVALAAGAAGAIVFPRPISLVDPPACSGLLELGGIVASRTMRDIPLGEMVIWANRLAVAAALVLFVRLSQRIAGDLAGGLAAAAVSIALLLSAPFDSVLAPTNAAPFAAACLVLLGSSLAGTVIALALLAGIAPALLWPCVLLAAWRIVQASTAGPRRIVLLATAVAAIAAGPVLVAMAAPPLPAIGAPMPDALACARPFRGFALADALDGLRSALGPISQFAIALAALGAFALRGAWRPVPHGFAGQGHPAAGWIAALVALPLVASALGATDPARTLAPVVVAVWLLVASGLREVVLAIAPRGPRWIAAALVLASLPWLQLAARPERITADADLVRGHDALNWQRFLQVLSAIPAGGGLVVEDAIVSMLATDAGRRRAQAGRPVVLIPFSHDQIARTLPRTAVFALPRRQSTLRHLGFDLVDLSPRASGVAEVRAGAPCQIADDTWRAAPALTAATGFALVADDDLARGPASVLFGSDVALSPERSWPRRAERGFASTEVDRQADAGDARFQGTLSAAGAPAGDLLAGSRFLTSIDIWRVPGGPLVLPVTFKGRPSVALIRRRGDAVPGRVRFCPSAPYDVKPFVLSSD